MRDLQSAVEFDCRYIFIAVEKFGKLTMKVADVGLEAIIMPHLNGEEVMVILLGLLAGEVLSEEHLGYLLEVAERCGGRE